MCLGIPGRVQEVYEARGTRMAVADFGGVTKTVCLAYVPEVGVGDYTIVHAGFAITRLDEGTYGTCEVCGQPIAPARLEAMPATRYCINHASRP